MFINESGLYALILSSKLPQAKAFKRWVTSEVLPQIRQTGGYIPTRDAEGRTLSAEEIIGRAGITDPMEMVTNVSIVAVVQVQVLAAGVVAQGIDNSNTSIILSSRNVHFYTKIARFCSVYCGSARLFTIYIFTYARFGATRVTCSSEPHAGGCG